MEAEEDDDIYAPGVADKTFQATNGKKSADVEEGEEADSDEEEESDSVRYPLHSTLWPADASQRI